MRRLPKELKQAAIKQGLKHSHHFIFEYKGHEIDLGDCTPDNILSTVATQLAEKLTDYYKKGIEVFFK